MQINKEFIADLVDRTEQSFARTEMAVFRQTQYIENLAISGKDTASAMQFLELLENNLEELQRHRRTLLDNWYDQGQ